MLSSDSVSSLTLHEVESIESIVLFLNSNAKKASWWIKVKIWVNDHYGSYLFNNCEGGGGCGPCAGVCFRFGTLSGDSWSIDDKDNLTPAQYSSGMRSFSISRIQNSETKEEKLLFETSYISDFATDSKLYIPNNIQLDDSLGGDLGFRNTILVESGIYPLVFNSQNGLYSTIIDIR